jgi:ATP synthase protein I
MQGNDVRALKSAAIPTIVVGLAVVAVAALLAGGAGAYGAAIGVALVAVFFTVGLAAVTWAGRVSPQMMMLAAVLGYLVKVILLMLVLSAFRDATVFSPRALGWSVVLCTITWTIGEVRAFLKLKMLYVDPSAEVPGRGPRT